MFFTGTSGPSGGSPPSVLVLRLDPLLGPVLAASAEHEVDCDIFSYTSRTRGVVIIEVMVDAEIVQW